MTVSAITLTNSSPALLAFSAADIATMKATVAKGCTDAEFELLMRLATTYGLDPFAKEIWAIKLRPTDPALIITSRDGYLKVAQRDPNYLGMQAAVVKKGDRFAFNPALGTVEHSFGTERGVILGAWAIAHHRGRMPVACYVEFSEYKGGSPIWSKYPSAMIQKVAEVFALKRQFGINGMVTKEEMDAGDAPDIIQPRVTDIQTGEVFDHQEPPAWAPSEAQLKRLYAIAKENGIGSRDELRAWLATLPGFPPKEGQLTSEQYNEVTNHRLPAHGAYLASQQEPPTLEAEVVDDEEDDMVRAVREAQAAQDADESEIP